MPTCLYWTCLHAYAGPAGMGHAITHTHTYTPLKFQVKRDNTTKLSTLLFLALGVECQKNSQHSPYFWTYPWNVMILKRESKLKSRLPFVISIFIQYKHLNIVRHEPLTLRLPFGGHGMPWKRLKIGPPEYSAFTLDFVTLYEENFYNHFSCAT